MNDELPQFSGHTVIDRHGTEVGMITDVLYDEMTEEPTWGVVSAGHPARPPLHPVVAAGLSLRGRRRRRALRQG